MAAETHGHAHGCSADHHRGDYTPQQRATLDLVLAFNHRLSEAIDGCVDTAPTVAALDPDPLRYMWVDEGAGQIPAQLHRAGEVLARAPRLAGHSRGSVRPIADSANASRPSIAVAADGRRLVCWLEWVEGQGERLMATLAAHGPAGCPSAAVLAEPSDLFRPTAAFDGSGAAWIFYGQARAGVVGVWAVRNEGAGWSQPEPISTTDAPSFNQEVVTHRDGGLEVCWQGRAGDRFGVYARRLAAPPEHPVWGETECITHEVAGNVWDPTLAATADGTAYGWTEYCEGSYAVSVRRRRAGRLGPVRTVTGGTDYALHPSLATTRDGRLWCAFDVVTVVGHGGSGPTRLRPRPQAGDHGVEQDGMRAPGDSVPPELLPEVGASIRVVALDDGTHPGAGDPSDGDLFEPPGDLAPGLNVVPSAMPRLVATADGGLVVAYRVHRQLPLMTYYWEVCAQALGPDGWLPPTTFAGTDATLEEVSATASGSGCVLATQADGRLERALHWTEGFGGRECPYLAAHHGSVVWHGVHGAGQVVTASMASAGPAPDPEAAGATRRRFVLASGRQEARRWAGGDHAERITVDAQGSAPPYAVYWGDLHRHSLVSRCTSGDEPSLEDFYRYAWDVCEYDFWAVTDHAENSSAYQWWSIQKIADLLHVPGRFVPFYGFEWTSADHGHQNVIYGDVGRGAPIFSAFAEGSTDPAGLWHGLGEHPAYPAVTIPHHPGSAMVHNDWDYYDERYSRLVEVFQACRGNYESDRCFRQYSDATASGTFTLDGLQRGHKFGLIASSDHGHGASYVGALSRSLSRTDIFDALWARRTFAASTRDVVAILSLGPHLMGSEVEWAGSRPLRVRAQGYAELARVDLLRDGVVVHTVRGEEPLPPGWLRADLRVEWGKSAQTTRWDGQLVVEGGRLVLPKFVGPEVAAMDESSIAWEATTFSFGDPYGAQRGGVEVSVCGPPEAMIRLRCGGRDVRRSLGEIVAGLASGSVPMGQATDGGPTLGELQLQPAIGALTGLGTTELDVAFVDDDPGACFYYARVVLVDGELAWSSPIWVTDAP